MSESPPLAITYREACKQALRQALLDDPRVFLMGEDIGRYGGCYAVTKGLLEEFGDERIRDAPLSESAFVGAGIGAAMAGMRPIVEIMTVNFSLLALDQIVNNAVTIPYMSGGQFAVPLVIRMATGGGRRVAAQHSHSLEGWYAHIPGLRVLTPATIDDARHMLLAALAEPNPTLIFEHVMLYNMEGVLTPGVTSVDIDHADDPPRGARRQPHHLWRRPVQDARRRRDAGEGGHRRRSARSAHPAAARHDAIIASVSKTRRCVIVDEAWRSGSFLRKSASRIVEGAFFELDAPPSRVCGREVPMPYAAHLEDACLPQSDAIVAAARDLVRPT